MVTPLVVSEDPVPAAVAPPLLVSQTFVEPVPVTTAPVPDLRRSSRLRTAAIPGAHRSYVGSTALPVSDPSMWTSVAGNKKTNAFIRRHLVPLLLCRLLFWFLVTLLLQLTL